MRDVDGGWIKQRGSAWTGRGVNGRSIIGSLARVMKGRSVSMEVKRGLRNNILLPTLTYGLETWTWNRAQQSRVCAVE